MCEVTSSLQSFWVSDEIQIRSTHMRDLKSTFGQVSRVSVGVCFCQARVIGKVCFYQVAR